jgi:hypothetical protein
VRYASHFSVGRKIHFGVRRAFDLKKHFSQVNENSIVKQRPDLLNRFIGTIGPCAVCQQDDCESALRVDPE